MEIRKLDQMFEVLGSRAKKRLIAAWAIDAHTIVAVAQAVQMGIIEGTLVGDEPTIKRVCIEHSVDPRYSESYTAQVILPPPPSRGDDQQSEGDFLMKVCFPPIVYMRAILNKERGLMDPRCDSLPRDWLPSVELP